jgi:hypothetical protein
VERVSTLKSDARVERCGVYALLRLAPSFPRLNRSHHANVVALGRTRKFHRRRNFNMIRARMLF